MAQQDDNDAYVDLIEAVLGALNAAGVLTAHVSVGPLELEVALSGAPVRAAKDGEGDADTDDDLGDQDPRFALERINAGRAR